MLTRIIITLIISSVSLFAQYTTTYRNLLRIPIDASQINPEDTVGSCISYTSEFADGSSSYTGIIHNPQGTFFEKLKWDYYYNYGLITNYLLENFENGTSDSYGVFNGEYDVPEPYLITNTVSIRAGNGTWLMNGLYTTAYLSDNGNITILPRNYYGDLLYICTEIDGKYVTVFRKDASAPAYDFYLLDLSNSPDFDTTNAERVYFDIPAAPYKIRRLGDSLYIAGIDSLPDMYPRLCLFNLTGDTFHYIKTFFDGIKNRWEFRNNHLFFYDGTHLYRYEYNQDDTSFINETVIAPGVVYNNPDFTLSAQYFVDSLFIYDNDNAQLLNTIDISSLWQPFPLIIDSPYVYIHQTTLITDLKENPGIPVKYNLQIYPNPFNPATNILYTLPRRSRVELKLIDLLGREVRDIYSGDAEAGSHNILLNAGDLASGIYFISLRSGDYFQVQKILLLK